jgi:hypothetical protein
LTWLAPDFNGGSPLLDYRVWTDDSGAPVYVVEAEGLTDLTYTSTGLT